MMIYFYTQTNLVGSRQVRIRYPQVDQPHDAQRLEEPLHKRTKINERKYVRRVEKDERQE